MRDLVISKQWLSVLLIPWFAACGAEDEDPLACDAAAKRVDDFVVDLENQACADSADCVVIVSSAPTRTDFCGQLGMTRAAYESAEWREIEAALASCPVDFETCEAALEARCSEGLCYQPRAGGATESGATESGATGSGQGG